MNYTITVQNLGAADFTSGDPAVLVDSLADVLDDADYNADAVASAGTVTYSAPALSWTTPLASGDDATLRYSVTVLPVGSGDGVMRNIVGIGPSLPTSALLGCDPDPAANGDESCFTSTSVARVALTGAAGVVPLALAASATLLLGVLALLVGLLKRRRREVGA